MQQLEFISLKSTFWAAYDFMVQKSEEFQYLLFMKASVNFSSFEWSNLDYGFQSSEREI